MNNGKEEKHGQKPKRPPLDEPQETGIPLAEEIEDAMVDQDIPTETGVRPPGSGERRQ